MSGSLRLLVAALAFVLGAATAAIGGFGTLASAFDSYRDNDLWVYIVFGTGLIAVGLLLLAFARRLALPRAGAGAGAVTAALTAAAFFPYASAFDGRGWIAVNVALGAAAVITRGCCRACGADAARAS